MTSPYVFIYIYICICIYVFAYLFIPLSEMPFDAEAPIPKMSGFVRKNGLFSKAFILPPCFRAPWNCRSTMEFKYRLIGIPPYHVLYQQLCRNCVGLFHS